MTRTMVAVARFGEVLTAPAVGAELVFGQSDGMNHVVDALEGERREVQLLADVFHHAISRMCTAQWPGEVSMMCTVALRP